MLLKTKPNFVAPLASGISGILGLAAAPLVVADFLSVSDFTSVPLNSKVKTKPVMKFAVRLGLNGVNGPPVVQLAAAERINESVKMCAQVLTTRCKRLHASQRYLMTHLMHGQHGLHALRPALGVFKLDVPSTFAMLTLKLSQPLVALLDFGWNGHNGQLVTSLADSVKKFVSELKAAEMFYPRLKQPIAMLALELCPFGPPGALARSLAPGVFLADLNIIPVLERVIMRNALVALTDGPTGLSGQLALNHALAVFREGLKPKRALALNKSRTGNAVLPVTISTGRPGLSVLPPALAEYRLDHVSTLAD